MQWLTRVMAAALACAVVLAGCGGGQESGTGRTERGRIVATGLAGARSLAVDWRGVVYAIADRADGVTCLYADGTRAELPVRAEAVAAVAVGPDGALFALDRDAGELLRLGEDGSHRVCVSGLPRPSALAVDRDGGVYVACAGDGSVRWFPAR